MRTKVKLDIPACENCPSRSYSIFCNLKPEELKELSANKGCNQYSKGQFVFFEGSRPTGLYCIFSGKIKVYKIKGDGKAQIVRLAKKGDILGYRSLLSGELYTSFATVLEEAQICYIPKSIFHYLIQSNSDFSLKVMDLFAKELWKAEEKLTSLALKPVRERLAEALLMLKEFYGVKKDKATLDVELTREELAGIVGTATETVVRLLSEFKSEQLVALDKKSIKILNQGKLFHIANLYD